MRFFAHRSDRELDDVLAGNTPAADGELGELAGFVRALRTSLTEAPPPSLAAAHVAAIVAAARSVEAPAVGRARRPFSSARFRVFAVAAGFALLAAFGGAAYAGALPHHVQGKVAGIAGTVGISLPGNNNDVNQGDAGNRNDGSNDNQVTTSTPTETPNQGPGGQGDQTGSQQGGGGAEGRQGTQAGDEHGQSSSGDQGAAKQTTTDAGVSTDQQGDAARNGNGSAGDGSAGDGSAGDSGDSGTSGGSGGESSQGNG
jgi:hypothetical protein